MKNVTEILNHYIKPLIRDDIYHDYEQCIEELETFIASEKVAILNEIKSKIPTIKEFKANPSYTDMLNRYNQAHHEGVLLEHDITASIIADVESTIVTSRVEPEGEDKQ